MRYNLYKRKKDNIYEYVECKISDIKFDDYKELWNNFNDSDYVVDISDDNLAFPILVNGKLREMTREEKIILLSDAILLKDGEYVEDGHIVQVPNPSTKYLKYSWSRDTFEWELSTTKEELQQAKTNLILEHNKKRKEIVSLNEEAEFFDVSESVTKANDELEEIRAKITEIDKVIEEMNKQQ